MRSLQTSTALVFAAFLAIAVVIPVSLRSAETPADTPEVQQATAGALLALAQVERDRVEQRSPIAAAEPEAQPASPAVVQPVAPTHVLPAPKRLPSFSEVQTRALRERRPMVVFVGVDPIDGYWLNCTVPSFKSAPVPSVLVMVPWNGDLYWTKTLDSTAGLSRIGDAISYGCRPEAAPASSNLFAQQQEQAQPWQPMLFGGGNCASGNCSSGR